VRSATTTPSRGRATSEVYRTGALLAGFEESLHERARRRRIPPARADHTTDQLPLAVDEVHGGRTPYTVDAPGHIPARVEQHRGLVAALLDGLAYEGGVLAEVDQTNLETLAAELLIQRVDGR
jgi:hypothetical protein